jgi:DNA-directed RNA polymerase specialized sigma24 family protein
MINNYINEHYQEILGKVKGVTKNHELTEDLLQDCILAFLEKGPDYISQIVRDNKVQHYLVRMCHIQFNSSTSPFYTKYRKTSFKTRSIENYDFKQEESELKEDKTKLSKDIKLYIGNLPLFEKTISHRHLVEGVSQREMSRYYNINRTHISASIDNVKKNIKIKFNRDDYKTE